MNAYVPEGGKKTADEYLVSTGTTQERGSYWYAPTGQGNLITQYGYDVTSTYDVKTMQHYQITEQAMEGFDCELGALLPLPVVRDYADIRAFAGYYDYNAHHGADIAGMKGRLEIKPLPSLYLDAAWFEDKALLGSRYSVGIRLSVPFDLSNLSRGKNPFAGATEGFRPGAVKEDFASRMTEMVVRDLHIRTDASEPLEVVSDRRVLEKKLTGTDRKDYNLVLASDVTFVDDDNQGGQEDGSWENPYRQINTGIQRAIGTMVYVRDAAQPYYENVMLRDGLTLWGSGAPLYGQGGRFLGGIYPVVNGMGRGPAITLANHVTVAGFEITQPAPDLTPRLRAVGNDSTGIFGDHVTDVNVRQNYIHGTGTGIQLNSQAVGFTVINTPLFTANISNNRVEDVRGDGIDIHADSVSKVELTLANNAVTRCGGDGVAIGTRVNDECRVHVSGAYSGNGGNGVNISANSLNGSVGIDLSDVSASGNHNHGILAELNAYGMIDATFSDIVAENNGNGLRVKANSDWAGINLSVANVEASGNRNNGIHTTLTALDTVHATVMGSATSGNGENGAKVETTSYNADVILTVAGNSAHNNGKNGIKTVVAAANDIDARYTGNKTGGNLADGLHVNVSAGQQLKLFGEGNVTKENGDDGIDVKTTAAIGSINRQYDFGGGVLGSRGNNIMAGNGGYDLERSGAGEFSAQYNYWDGIVPPFYGSEYIGNNMNVAHALDTEPTLP